MSINKTDDAVAEYLHELELRLSGLPVLQRRELLADLEAHISNERAERGLASEGELLDMLERLGSPEVVAAAAYEEAGLLQPADRLQPLGAGRSCAGEDAAASRPLPPVPPPPDSPPFGGPFPPAGSIFAEPPPYAVPPPFTGPPPFASPAFGGQTAVKQGSKTGVRVAFAVAIVTAVFIALGCLAGALLLGTDASVVDGGYSDVPAPVPPAPTAPVLPGE